MRFASAGRFAGHSLNSLPALTALALLSALAAATLTGCGIGDISTSSSTAASVIPPLTGKIMGGQTPILNASVKIYTTGVITTPCTSSACSASDTGYGNGTFLQEATATAQPIPGIWITNGGSNYTQPPVITFSGGGGGSGAAATAFLGSGASAGQVVGITVTSSGSGYTTAPTVVFTNASGDTSGAGAAATTGYGGYDAPGGNFSFAGGYYCPAGEFAYIVASGGQPGNTSNAPNSAIELVAALGRCEDLYTLTGGVYTGYKGSSVTVNELTTVAAAYALGNFSSAVSNGVVTFGAPATNNAAKVSGVSTGTTTNAAGLYHAFLNAKNLADPTNPSVQFTAPTNPVGNSSAVLPVALINTIANILANCVNATSTNTQCTGLPGGSDTFTAARTLAANPTLSGSGTAVTNLYNLPTGSAQFTPILAGAPNDYSIAITIPNAYNPAAGTAPLAFPASGAIDVNDNYYLGNQDKHSGTQANFFSFASNAALNNQTAKIASEKFAVGVSIDALGNLYLLNSNGSSSTGLYRCIVTLSSGTVGSCTSITGIDSGTSHPYNSAIDRANNLWVLTDATAGNNLFKVAYNGSAGTGAGLFSGVTLPTGKVMGIAVDPLQNIWIGGGSGIAVLQNSSTTSTPAYAGTNPTATISGASVDGFAFIGSSSSYQAYVPSYYTSGTPITGYGVEEVTPAISTNSVTGLTASGTLETGNLINGPQSAQADGSGTVWLADGNSNSVISVTPSSPTAAAIYRLMPCFTNGGTTCTNTFTGQPQTLSIDSTGSIWVADGNVSSTTAGNVVQIIGSAAPTWPLLSLGLLGKP
jgi:hypothetical protein